MVFSVQIGFRQRVQGSGGLIQYYEGGIFIERPGQHQPLGFTAGEHDGILMDITAQLLIILLRQGLYFFGKPGFFDAFTDTGHIDGIFCLGHIGGYGDGQQAEVLENHGEHPVIITAVIASDVLSVQKHASLRGIQKTAQELDQSGLAGAV